MRKILLYATAMHAAMGRGPFCVPAFRYFAKWIVRSYYPPTKSQGIGKDLGMERWVLPLERSERLAERLSLLWEGRAEISAALMTRQENIIQRCDEQEIGGNLLSEAGK